MTLPPISRESFSSTWQTYREQGDEFWKKECWRLKYDIEMIGEIAHCSVNTEAKGRTISQEERSLAVGTAFWSMMYLRKIIERQIEAAELAEKV